MRKVLIINTEREGYTVNQVGHTLTVGELQDLLSSYPDNMEVFLGFDNQYTFGSIEESMFQEKRVDDCEDD